jgi:hypothetical protein
VKKSSMTPVVKLREQKVATAMAAEIGFRVFVPQSQSKHCQFEATETRHGKEGRLSYLELMIFNTSSRFVKTYHQKHLPSGGENRIAFSLVL